MGTCLAAGAGSRSTSCATPSDTATSTATVNAFRPTASPMANATSTPSTTAAERSIAVRTDARTDTCTTTTAVTEASTGAGTPVTMRAIHHDRPAANPDLPTMTISVDVGAVQETARWSRDHSRPTQRRRRAECVATLG